MKRMCLQHADAYLHRQTTSLLLIVSSRGRRLSRLNDAIAATLQDLKIGLFYTEIPVLVRLGLIVLIIDGFDELVNADGYEEAWGSMAELIDNVDGCGTLVLSARDTFFTDQDFVKRARKWGTAERREIEFSFLRLTPWRLRHALPLLQAMEVPPDRMKIVAEYLEDSSNPITARPFFIRRLADHIRGEDALKSITAFVIDVFIEREVGILFGDIVGSDEIEKTMRRLFVTFCEEVALEMRRQEHDWLEVDTIGFWLDIVLDHYRIPDERRRALVHRAGSMGFMELTKDVSRGRRGFPHELVRDHFVARRLLKCLSDGNTEELRQILSVGSFDIGLNEAVLEAAWGYDFYKNLRPEVVELLLEIGAESHPSERLSVNAHHCAIAVIRAMPTGQIVNLSDQHISLAYLVETVLPSLNLNNCVVEHLDLSGTDASDCNFIGTTVLRLRVSAGSLLPGSGFPTPAMLEYYPDDGHPRIERKQDRIQEVLNRLSSRAEGDIGLVVTSAGQEMALRLARRWVRKFYLDENDFEDERAFASPLWPQVKAVLMAHGRLVSKQVQARGENKPLLHLKEPMSLVTGHHQESSQQEAIHTIWRELASIR